MFATDPGPGDPAPCENIGCNAGLALFETLGLARAAVGVLASVEGVAGVVGAPGNESGAAGPASELGAAGSPADEVSGVDALPDARGVTAGVPVPVESGVDAGAAAASELAVADASVLWAKADSSGKRNVSAIRKKAAR